jgi:hypothetical protein
MLDPTTFPTAIPAEPLQAACIEANSSGDEVPRATTVSPTIKGDTFAFRAKPEEFRTNASPPKLRRINPPNNTA